MLLLGLHAPAFGQAVFEDVTAAAGMAQTGYTFGNPIWGDFNNDGNLDLFVENHYNAYPHLYQNNGDGTFTDVVSDSKINLLGDKHGAGWGDIDNDGKLDLVITKGASGGHSLGSKRDELYLNLGNGVFRNITRTSGTANTLGRGRSVILFDYDGDGYIDLLDANFQTDLILYRNNHNDTFTDVTAAAGLTGLKYAEGAAADYDNDGYPDLFFTVAYESHQLKDVLFRNNGNGTFSNVTRTAHLGGLSSGRAVAWGDYNNDGYLDLFVSRGKENASVKQTLYQNNGNGTFTDVSDLSGVGITIDARAAVWGDYDNDGYLDLYVVNSGSDPDGKGPNYLFHNNGNGTFTDVAASAGVDVSLLTRGRTACWADYDKDGFLDLFETNGEDNTIFQEGPQFLFHNTGNDNHWLEVNLVGSASNHQGLGAKVTLTVGTSLEYREADGSGGGHYYSQGAGPLHFGLGSATLVDQVTIKWRDGVTQTLTNVAADQLITVTEGQ